MTADLGPYLTARRGRVRPQDVGLPSGRGRRVPGLRREEVAMLAGVSVDYYARLEQGRERHPSPALLDALAGALRLDGDQREHVFRLAGLVPAAAPDEVHAPVPDALVRLLDAWPQTPALLLDRRLDVLAHNALAAALYAPFARVDNVVRMTFTDPAARGFYADWDRAAESCVASLRLALGHRDTADAVRRLVAEVVGVSAEFRRLWGSADARGKTRDVKGFRHPAVGDLVLDAHTFDVRGLPGRQVVVYTAAPGTSSADKLHLFASWHAAPSPLRD